jgi:hypothetical protein
MLSDSLHPFLQQAKDVVTYANTELIGVSRRYDCTVPLVISHTTGDGMTRIINRRGGDGGNTVV